MASPLSHRLSAAQSHLDSQMALLVSDVTHIEYLTGYQTLTPDEREAFVILAQNDAILLLGSFSPYHSPPPAGLTIKRGPLRQTLAQVLTDLTTNHALTQLFIDADTLSLREYHSLQELLPPNLTTGIQTVDPIDELRIVKDKIEISALKQANHITHRAITKTLATLKVGETEIQAKNRFAKIVRRLGGSELAFPTIVAFGPNTALPHHQPTDTELTVNTPVLIDAGVEIDSYCGDMTRTIWFGDIPDSEFLQIEAIVKDAYDAVIDLLSGHSEPLGSAQGKLRRGIDKSSLTAADLDAAARNLITSRGFGPQFFHTTGHGVGLSIHEAPSLNPRNQTVIKPGMIITNEPGIYLQGKFGYRFEDTLLVTETGFEILD